MSRGGGAARRAPAPTVQNMPQENTGVKDHLYPTAIAVAGIGLWLAAAGVFCFAFAWREQLSVLMLLPLVVMTGMFPTSLPLPSALRLSREKMTFTLSDAFILLIACQYGFAACVLVAGVEGLTSSRRAVRRLSSNLFSFGMMSLAAASAAASLSAVLRYGFGEFPPGAYSFPAVAVGMLVAGGVHIVVNTGLISVLFAARLGASVASGWWENFRVAAPIFLPTGAAASLMYFGLQYSALTVVAIGAPILIAIHFGHRQYRDNLQEQINLIESADRERAEAERLRAEAAERHVRELELANRALEESREHFRHAAYHDVLTGLPNRLQLTDRLRLAIEQTRRLPGHSFALVFLDLDRFKYVNDSLGHAAGDRLLVAIARRLEAVLRPSDVVARLGGDEFAILLDGLEEDGDAVRVAKRVQEGLDHPFNLNGHEVFTTASVGITLSATGYDQPEHVLRDADTAMYRAKENGKARYEVFDAVMHARAVERLRMENDLRRAVERGAFQVHYQPIVSLATDEVAGFEALVRWERPGGGFVSPSEFIPIAEETGLIVEIGRMVLAESCRQMREWQQQSPANRALTVSVNLSGKQFLQPDLIGQVRRTLEETGLAPHSLKLEITESIMMENAEAASEMLVQLRGMGVQLSIDDFGTGYSSLSYLHRFPVNILKVDRSFVMRMGEGGENSEIVRTILTLASNLGMEVIAEGIETPSQLSQLKGMGCAYGQGYIFSRPVSAERAGALLRPSGWREAEAAALPPGAPPEAPELLDSAFLM